VAPVAVQDGGDLRDSHSLERSLDHHLTGELHARGAQAEAGIGVATQPAKPAVEVAEGSLEEKAPDGAEHRIAEISMLPGHRSGVDSTYEPVSHHQVVTLAQLFDEGQDLGEVVAQVRIADDHEGAARRLDSRPDRRPVAPLARAHDADA